MTYAIPEKSARSYSVQCSLQTREGRPTVGSIGRILEANFPMLRIDENSQKTPENATAELPGKLNSNEKLRRCYF